jgi:hypothetical protein
MLVQAAMVCVLAPLTIKVILNLIKFLSMRKGTATGLL